MTTSNSLQYSTMYVTSSSTPAITIKSTLTQSVTTTQQSYNTIESKSFNNHYSLGYTSCSCPSSTCTAQSTDGSISGQLITV